MTSRTGNRLLGESGFTLVEVLVASVILCAGLIAVLRAFGSAVEALGYANDVLVAAQIAEAKASEVELDAGLDRSRLHSSSGVVREPNGDYSWMVTCRDVSTTAGEQLRELEISVGRLTSRGPCVLVSQWATILRPTGGSR